MHVAGAVESIQTKWHLPKALALASFSQSCNSTQEIFSQLQCVHSMKQRTYKEIRKDWRNIYPYAKIFVCDKIRFLYCVWAMVEGTLDPESKGSDWNPHCPRKCMVLDGSLLFLGFSFLNWKWGFSSFPNSTCVYSKITCHGHIGCWVANTVNIVSNLLRIRVEW